MRGDSELPIIYIYKNGNMGKVVTSMVFLSRSSKVDLVFLYFLFHFYFIFNLFFIFLFLELRVRVSDDITMSHISHSIT